MATEAAKRAARPTQPDIGMDYWRLLFRKEPLLAPASNDQLATRWLTDHPSYDMMPPVVGLALKAVKKAMRDKRRRGKRSRSVANHAGNGQRVTSGASTTPDQDNLTDLRLSDLRDALDECITMAKVIDRKALSVIIDRLVVARDEVVLKMG